MSHYPDVMMIATGPYATCAVSSPHDAERIGLLEHVRTLSARLLAAFDKLDAMDTAIAYQREAVEETMCEASARISRIEYDAGEI